MFENYYSEQIKTTPSSFIRSIFGLLKNPEIISFAGGMPNPKSFPQKELQESMIRITEKYQDKLYQYSTTLGIDDLRQYVAEKYKKDYGMNITEKNVVITTGSQQAVDILGKTFINKGDSVLIEKPTFLGFLQIFYFYGVNFLPVTLNDYGLDIEELKASIKKEKPKLAYLIPNFQNPTGITYSKENREAVFDILKDEDTIIVQDDAYGQLYFDKQYKLPYIGVNDVNKNIYLGSFSKIVSPGLRMGYIIANEELVKKIEVAKQMADAHSSVLNQYLILDYMQNNDTEAHIEKIRELYKNQANAMIEAIKKNFGDKVSYTEPKGGMFTWVTLPEDKNALELFNKAIEKKVAFIPGKPFYTIDGIDNTLRLNFSNANIENIEIGIERLAEAYNVL